MSMATCGEWPWPLPAVLVVLAAVGARELDPAACASRFDVQRDKIIRTEESREMGARYLSELDVGARHECLRLCCETDSCDVFVYEEKSSGSCYLFNCGPPEDFRCKFTAHSNFSSGVLALSRRLAELQDQERLAQHEQELASLRVATSTTSRTTTTSTTPPPTAAVTTPRPQPRPPPQLPRRRCSRYEFECHSGDECIAVYNVCDGVAQCADGSDEAPELACPSAPSSPPPPTTTRASTAQPPMLLPPEIPSPSAERWPHRLTQAQPQHRYNVPDAGPSSHIFSHKGGLLQEPEAAVAGLGLSGGMPQYQPFEPPWGARRTWSQSQQTGLESMPGERGWMSGSGGAAGGYPRLDWPEPDPRRSWQEPDPRRAWPVPQPRPEPEMPVYIPPKTMPEIPLVYSSQQQTLRDSPKKGLELSNLQPKKKPAEASTEAPRARAQTAQVTTKAEATAAVAPARVQSAEPPAYLSAAHEREHEGLSEHPPAAVLLLVLGVAMTGAMAVMVGCRARAARRRRLRRGKSSFAHDADYLVNGMYL